MGAGWAFFRSFFALMNVAAVTTSPGDLFFLLEHAIFFDVFGQGQVAFFMLLLGHGNGQHDRRYLRETFFLGDPGEFRVLCHRDGPARARDAGEHQLVRPALHHGRRAPDPGVRALMLVLRLLKSRQMRRGGNL